MPVGGVDFIIGKVDSWNFSPAVRVRARVANARTVFVHRAGPMTGLEIAFTTPLTHGRPCVCLVIQVPSGAEIIIDELTPAAIELLAKPIELVAGIGGQNFSASCHLKVTKTTQTVVETNNGGRAYTHPAYSKIDDQKTNGLSSKTDNEQEDQICDIIENVQVAVASDGGLKITLCGDSYTVTSHFSYPMMRDGRWSGFGTTSPCAFGTHAPVGPRPTWVPNAPVHALQETNSSFPITISGQYEQLYRVECRVSRPVTGTSRLLVNDQIINLSGDDLGLAFGNYISVRAADRPECVPRPYLPEQARDGYYFSAANNVTGKGLMNVMFPITVRQIFNGTIVGDERVITLHSGSHAFGSSGQEAAAGGGSALCHRFDGFGAFSSL